MLFSTAKRGFLARHSALLAILALGTWTIVFDAGCSAGNGGPKPEPEFNPDVNGDGFHDAIGRPLDLDGDGIYDQFDINGDGVPDGFGIDTNGDGKFDGIAIDTNGDGIYDGVDTTGNGIPDITGDGDMPMGDGDLVVTPGDGDGDMMEGEYCDTFETNFVPQVPTVYILVDHSSSMFDLDFWEPLKSGVLDVVQALQADVRFGFGTFTGDTNACTGMTPGAPIDLNNYDAVAAAYDAVPSWMPGDKKETPTALALQQVLDLLANDESTGKQYIFLVSDGEPDFCDDNLGVCAADATIAAIQYAHSLGIGTFVFGLASDKIADPQLFDFMAQAGVGEEPAWADGLDVSEYTGLMESRCADPPDAQPWRDLQVLMGNDPPADACGANQPPEGNTDCYMPAGNYSTAGGTATAFLEADPAALASQIQSSVEGLKSCSFEFNFEVTDATTGDIFVGDLVNPIPQDQWTMVTPSTLELTGAACEKWLSPDVLDFSAGFPCESIVQIIR
jgi:hypothetical protein